VDGDIILMPDDIDTLMPDDIDTLRRGTKRRNCQDCII
jgi:hypothetical protein